MTVNSPRTEQRGVHETVLNLLPLEMLSDSRFPFHNT